MRHARDRKPCSFVVGRLSFDPNTLHVLFMLLLTHMTLFMQEKLEYATPRCPTGGSGGAARKPRQSRRRRGVRSRRGEAMDDGDRGLTMSVRRRDGAKGKKVK